MKFSRLAVPVVSCFLFLSLFHSTASSQAVATASKSQEISVFGAYMGGITDFGPRAYEGASAGADYTFFPRWRVAPSFEVRASELLGSEITEKTVQFGPRLQMDIHDRFHPYVDVLYGGGEVLFHPYQQFAQLGYTGDRGRVISYGGGVNIDIARHFAAKFDVQGESFTFDGSYFTTGNNRFTLTPIVASAGIVYTVPFRKRNRREDFR